MGLDRNTIQRNRVLSTAYAMIRGPMLGTSLGSFGPSAEFGGRSGNRTRAAANALLRTLLSNAVIDWQAGALVFNWKHGGSSALPFEWPGASP
jgi:hypothetical protein